MNFVLGYVIILGIYLPFYWCYNTTVTVDPYHKEIYTFVNLIATDYWNQKHERDINDISIINLENDTSLFHIVRKALPKDQAIFLPDCSATNPRINTKIRSASIVVIITKIVANLEYYIKRLSRCVDSGFWSTQSNVIVVPSTSSNTSTSDLVYPCYLLALTRTQNFIIPKVTNGKITSVYKSDMLRRKCTTVNVTCDTDKLFSNNLNNMNGYTYTAIGNKADKFLLPDIQLMETIAEAQNARLNVSLCDISSLKTFRLENGRRMVDMFLNLENFAFLMNRSSHLKVNTYDVNGYCVLVPIADDSKNFLQVTVHPFKREVWLYLLLSSVSATMVWCIHKKLHSHQMDVSGPIIGDLISAFLQQSVNTRKGPFGIKVMLQLFIFMMIVIGNVYQGMITSALMDHRNHNEFYSVKELFSKKYVFYTDELFMERINDSITYKNNRNKFINVGDGLGMNYSRKLLSYMTAKPKNVFIVQCNSVPELLNAQIDQSTKARDVYREFPKKIFAYYKSILLTRRSPFHEKLSELSLRIQESGIKQHWQMLRKDSRQIYKRDSDEHSMINLSDIKPVMQLHFHGLLLAGYTCLFEILWTKFIKNYIGLIYRRWIKKGLKMMQKYRNRKVSPRLQQVKIVGGTQVEEDMTIYPYLP